MKKQILLIVLILLSNNIRAQITSGVDSVFGSLDTSEMNTDLLYDKGFNSEFYKNYNGSNDQSCSFNNWQQLYSGIFFGQMNLVRSHPTLQEVMQQARDYHKENADVLPLLILNYKYDVFKSNVFEDNLIAIQNGVFLDQPSTESPYEEGRFFASAAISNRIRSLQMKYFIGSEFYFTNDEEIPLSIEIDFDDGIGYRNVNFNQTITVNYIDTQSKTIKVKFNYASKII